LGRTGVDDALLRLDMLTKEENTIVTAKILEVAQNVNENMNTVVNLTQDVRNTVIRSEEVTQTANRTAQATSASVYRFLDLFINVLTDFLAICQNRSGQYQGFVGFQFYVVNCRR
jgi:hypothetical protein